MPKFYLKAFQSAPKRIHLYNLTSRRAIKDASLRHQCYKRRFYGHTDAVENALAKFEGHVAPVLQSIRTDKILPAAGTDEYVNLLAFVSLQVLRTTVVAKHTNLHIDKMIKQMHSRDARMVDENLDAIRVGYEDPVLASLKNLPYMLDAISDLRAHLVLSSENAFLTSDNPAFRYNQYCEDVQYMGTIGALSRGFQIFVPLAPDLQLILYDATTYNVRLRDRSSRCSVATRSDVNTLNTIQLVSADEQIYFSDWAQAAQVDCFVPIVKQHRVTDPTVVLEYEREDESDMSLLTAFTRTPCLKLRLSFLHLKRRWRKVLPRDRVPDSRRQMPIPTPLPPGPPSTLRGQTVTFSRFLGRR